MRVFSVLIISCVCSVFSGANAEKIVSSDEIVSLFYQSEYNEVIEKGTVYLLSTDTKKNLNNSLDVLSHVFKSYVKINKVDHAFELIRRLKKANQDIRFGHYLQFYEACIYTVGNQNKIGIEKFEDLLCLEQPYALPDTIQAKIYHNLAVCYPDSELSQKLYYYKKGYELAEELLITKNDYLGYNLSAASYLGFLVFSYKRFEQAFDLYYQVLSLPFNKKVNSNNEYLYSTYLTFCTRMGLWDRFDKVVLELEDYYLNNIESFETELSGLYNNWGTEMYQRGRYSESINYFQKALSVSKPIVSYRNFRPTSCLKLARVYKMIDNEKLSTQYAVQSIHESKLKKSNDLYYYYARVAYLFSEWQQREVSGAYLDSAIVLARSEKMLYSDKVLNNQIAWTNLELEIYNESLKYFDQYEQILKKDQNVALYDYWDNTNDMALAYLGLKNYKKATGILTSVYRQVEEKCKIEILENNSSDIARLFKRINLNLAKAYYGIYQNSNEESDLHRSYEHLIQGEQSIQTLRSQLRLDADQLVAGDLYAEYIELAVKVTKDLFFNTRNEKYLRESYQYVQKGKSYSLLLGVNDKQWKIQAGIPDSLINLENTLKGRLAFYQNEADQLRTNSSFDEESFSYLNEQRNSYFRQLDSLNTVIAQEYPRYYQLKYAPQYAVIEEIQERLGPDQVLIDYFLTDNRLMQYVMTSTMFKQFEVDVDSVFKHDLNYTINEIATPFIGSGNSIDRVKQMAKSSYGLYEKLLGNLEDIIEGKSLIIIPHGELAYLSFEALLTDDVSDQKPDMRKYPWLINKNSIIYEYNAAILPSFKYQEVEFNKIYSFAPDYYGNVALKDSILVNIRQAINNYLVPLESAKEEIIDIAHIFDSEIFEGIVASKDNFIENAGENNIMHLAMHSLIDEVHPLNSQLVFSSVDDSNNVLKAYELYNYDLHSPMVVLSSCSTGRGKRKTGEGLISMARAFKFSGIEAQVFTLWPVHDQSGARLMELFYQYLKKHSSKDQALRQAKVDYVQGSDAIKAHPYYWANYVISGDISPIKQNSNNYYWYLLLLLPLIVIGLMRRRK